MFGKTDPVAQKLLAEIEKLSKQLAELKGEREANTEALKLSDDIVRLREELTKLRIEKDRETEKHAREKRETEHLVGLQKKRADQERELAVKEAQLQVREENLTSKESMFEERLDTITEQLKEQVEYLRSDIVKSLMERLPIFKVDTMFRPGNGGSEKARALPRGDDEDDD